jgi:hypothetical protein
MHHSPYALLLLLIPLALIYPLAKIYARITDRWKLIVEGMYIYAEDGCDTYFKRRSRMVPFGRNVRRSWTRIRFRDGRTFILRPKAELPGPPGSRIRIMYNSWEGHRIDPV